MALWTEERDNELKARHATGMPFSQIGAKMGVSRNAAIGRAGRLGLAKRIDTTAPRVPRTYTPRARTEPRMRTPQQRNVIPFKPVSADVPPFGAKSLVDLGPDECKWPYGDRDFVFCALPADEGQAFCPCHRGMAYVRARAA